MQSACVPPSDELVCSVVQFEWITFENGVLSVPTSLDADAVEEAEQVCSFFETAEDQGSGALLGIEFIDTLGATGALITSCESGV